MKLFARCSYALLRETAQLRRAPLPLFIAFVFPVLSWGVIALALLNPVLSDVPVVVVNEDTGALSRTLIRSIDATQALHVVRVTGDNAAAQDAFQRGEAVIILHIAGDFTKNIRRGGSSEVVVLTNGAQLLYSKIAYRAIATAVYTVSAGILIRRFEAQGMTPEQALARALPVHTEIHGLGNTWYDYGIYLAPGMMFALLQMSASFSTLWFFRRHREHNAAIVLPQPRWTAAFLFGRGFPLFLANTTAVLVLFLVLFPCAGVPFSSATPWLILLTLCFTYTMMGMGTLFSVAFPNLVTAMQISLIINAPAFVFSGYTFPRWAMPPVIQRAANLVPLTHFLDGALPMLLYNTPTTNGLLPLLLFALVFWGGAGVILRIRMRSAPVSVKVGA